MEPPLIANVRLSPLNFIDDFPQRAFDLEIDGPPMKVGRASRSESKNLLQAAGNVWVESPVISRDHASIWATRKEGHKVYIKDVGSLHGTFVNNRQLVKDESWLLWSGDTLTFGTEISRGAETYPPRKYKVEYEWHESDRHTSPALSSRSTYRVPEAETDEEDYDDEDEDDDENSNEIAASVTRDTDLDVEEDESARSSPSHSPVVEVKAEDLSSVAGCSPLHSDPEVPLYPDTPMATAHSKLTATFCPKRLLQTDQLMDTDKSPDLKDYPRLRLRLNGLRDGHKNGRVDKSALFSDRKLPMDNPDHKLLDICTWDGQGYKRNEDDTKWCNRQYISAAGKSKSVFPVTSLLQDGGKLAASSRMNVDKHMERRLPDPAPPAGMHDKDFNNPDWPVMESANKTGTPNPWSRTSEGFATQRQDVESTYNIAPIPPLGYVPIQDTTRPESFGVIPENSAGHFLKTEIAPDEHSQYGNGEQTPVTGSSHSEMVAQLKSLRSSMLSRVHQTPDLDHSQAYHTSPSLELPKDGFAEYSKAMSPAEVASGLTTHGSLGFRASEITNIVPHGQSHPHASKDRPAENPTGLMAISDMLQWTPSISSNSEQLRAQRAAATSGSKRKAEDELSATIDSAAPPFPSVTSATSALNESQSDQTNAQRTEGPLLESHNNSLDSSHVENADPIQQEFSQGPPRKRARTSEVPQNRYHGVKNMAKVLSGAVIAGVGTFLALAASYPEPVDMTI